MCQNCGCQPDAKKPKGSNRLAEVWQRVIGYVKARDFENAYRLVLKEGDDMYLLRLIVTTGPVVSELDSETSKHVLKRINKIVRGGVFELLAVDWLEESNRCG